MSFCWRFFTIEKRRVICILVAAIKDGDLFYLTRPYIKEELKAVKSNMQFFCPTCGSPVILKIGEVKLPHFAHKTLSYCDSYSEPESSLHLQGKTLLYQFFSSKTSTVELEKYFPAIRQRADLLVDRHTAIEFQCSPIPAAQIAARSLGYTQVGVPSVWIGGLGKPLAEGIQQLKLAEWKKEMLQRKQQCPYLIMYAPEENRFYYYSNLIFISGTQWIGKVKSLDASRQRFPFAVPKRVTEKEFETIYSLFYQTRKKFISSQYYAKNRMQNPFWRSCYELQLDIRRLPDAIGVPVKNAEIIFCNSVLWQMQAIEATQKGISVTSLVQSGKIPVHHRAAAKEAEALLESYLSLYDKLKGKSNGQAGFMNLLYDSYCKTL
ncbi:competence protein CoiA [Planomicrobium sp. CPCC 101079]|uniref:competence protein CoiA n=1 Tax=Planomicrobium sp. CPCC 101079 TaxID=2599618 RepID=UPI001C98099A|nr:competence protein CoiA family protein [Planomicrobium sp. CPCC 101079]